MQQVNIYNFENSLSIIEDILKNNLLPKYGVYYDGEARYVPGIRFPVNVSEYSNISSKKISNSPTTNILAAMLLKDILIYHISLMNPYKVELYTNPFISDSEPIYPVWDALDMDVYESLLATYIPHVIHYEEDQFEYEGKVYNDATPEYIFTISNDEMVIIEREINRLVTQVMEFISEAPEHIYEIDIESKYFRIIRKEHIEVYRYEELKRLNNEWDTI